MALRQLFLARYIHNWFGYLSCFGLRNPDLTPRVYDCRPAGWQPDPNADDQACVDPCNDGWESPETTGTIPKTKRAATAETTQTTQFLTTVTKSAELR